MGTAWRSKSWLNSSCVLLIVIGGAERFAFKGVAGNLVTYLTDVMEMSNSLAAQTVNSWCGITSMLPLFVAPLADSYWNQNSTILAASSLYILGLVALTWTALAQVTTSSALLWPLLLISLGQGGYNPSLQAFAADQLETPDDHLPCYNKQTSLQDDDVYSKRKSAFFQWWYFGICSGSFLGVTLMSYVQETFGWGLGFAIPATAMVASIAFFCSRSRHYTYKKSKGAMGRHSIKSTFRAVRKIVSKVVPGHVPAFSKSYEIGQELEEKPLCHPKHEEQADSGDVAGGGGTPLEKAAPILRLLPIWTMLLMFAVIFQLPNTFFIKQGATMKRTIAGGFKIPPAALQTAINLSILLLMPLYDTVLVPAVRFALRSEGVSVKQRMGVGMLLSVAAMAIAAAVESRRREAGQGGGEMVIFWLLPQYVLLGVSDVFTVVGMQEFFYGEVPERMRTMGIALYTSVFGVGSFLSAGLISAVEFFTRSGGSWLSDDMEAARLDKYYWLLAGGTAVSLAVFIVLCRFYEAKDGSVDGDDGSVVHHCK